MEKEQRLIDANAAIERAKNSDKIVRSSIWETGEVVEFLEDCPTVDAVEVVHGRWRWCGSDRWNDAYQCSNCGKIAMNDSNYCPNCGAKMDGERRTDGSDA